MDRKESPHGIRDPSRAPEVAPSSSPIPTERESEGLQVEYDYTSGKEAIASGGLVGQDEQAAHYGEPATAKSRKWYRRKRWLLAIALLVVVILAAAVGAGVGASRPGNELDGQTASEGQNVHPGEGSQGASPSPSTSTAPSLTSSAATAPATDGLAAYACTNGSYLYSGQPSGYAYIEHCHTMYAFNQPSIFSVPAGNIDGLGSSIKYSLQACVDGCDDWNAANPDADAPCRAVSYYANLTYVFGVHAEWGGNCILKSGVGGVTTNNTDDSTADWAHTASAYRACLQQGTPCDASS